MPFQKGNKLSQGAPRREFSVTKTLRDLLAMSLDALSRYRPKTNEQLMALRLIKQASSGEHIESESQSMRAFEIIIDRLEGKPTQRIEQEVTDNQGHALLEALATGAAKRKTS